MRRKYLLNSASHTTKRGDHMQFDNVISIQVVASVLW